MDYPYWYLFPVAIIIATIANGAGIGGATFFSPLFATGTALVIPGISACRGTHGPGDVD